MSSMCYGVVFPGGSEVKASACNAGDLSSIPGPIRSLEKEMATTPVSLPREFHGWRILEGYVHVVTKSQDKATNIHIKR